MKEPRIRYTETGEPMTDEYCEALDTYEKTLDDKFEFDREEKMKKVTPEKLAYIVLETEIIYEDNSFARLVKLFDYYSRGKLYYEDHNEGVKVIYENEATTD